METPGTIFLGVQCPSYYERIAIKEKPDVRDRIFAAYLTNKMNIQGRILFTLAKYFVEYTKMFRRVSFEMVFEADGIFENGTAARGLIKLINASKVDIGVLPKEMDEKAVAVVDFAYPFRLSSQTFVIPKPEYEPKIFSIFQTLSLPVWIAILSTFIAILLVYYILLQKKYPFSKILLNLFAILLRQSSIITNSSFAEHLLVYSWVLGAMFLCLAYDSVFLSFLAFPPVSKIKYVSDLARAVENGEYQCMTGGYNPLDFGNLLLDSKEMDLQVIGADILKNNLSYHKDTLLHFIHSSRKKKLAFVGAVNTINRFAGKYFVSEDRFWHKMDAMIVQKNFCCKKLLDTFVHRMMASGIYNEYVDIANFKLSLSLLLEYPKEETGNRKLTLTELAPAFIFLVSGYFISCLVLVGEILFSYKNKFRNIKKNKRIKRRARHITFV